jgi:hypothetical protein
LKTWNEKDTNMSHALERTSPKGKGQEFIGYCTKCGKQDLPMSAVQDDCPMDTVVSDETALIDAINK